MRPKRAYPLATMRTVLLCLLFLHGCSVPRGRPTETAAGQGGDDGDMRVAVVDVGRVIQETPQGQEVGEQLEAAQREAENRMRDLEADMQVIADEIEQARQAGDPEEGIVQREGELVELRQQGAETGRALQGQLEQGRAQLTQPLLAQLSRVAGRIAEAGRYDLVLDSTRLQYADDGVDITDDVVRAMVQGADVLGSEDDASD